jgi:hypothetical protein
VLTKVPKFDILQGEGNNKLRSFYENFIII